MIKRPVRHFQRPSLSADEGPRSAGTGWPIVRSMDSPKAWLIDVYGTVLRVDWQQVYEGLAEIAGVPSDAFRAAFAQVVDEVMTRKGFGPQAMARILAMCGQEPSPGRVEALVAEDQRLLIDHARVFEDAVDFLRRLRAAGACSALVSNCGDHTRGLLVHFGFDSLVDEFVLSSEVGFLKPDARIFQYALDRLGVAPQATVFVDDKVSYCRGAQSLGMGAVQLVRQAGPSGTESLPGDPLVVASFTHLALA
jgi:HAD superfamily hydrolase (TIGR01509 family)